MAAGEKFPNLPKSSKRRRLTSLGACAAALGGTSFGVVRTLELFIRIMRRNHASHVELLVIWSFFCVYCLLAVGMEIFLMVTLIKIRREPDDLPLPGPPPLDPIVVLRAP
ncbi:MAG TPA: hypothetical protein PK677_00870 [Acidiphilium sp.]|nr:hypothetical protein [Acidiphilium sp.]HQU24508.1 hypothetical protein [Acidiphilium sp.]